eukprot:NODE_6429_length_886_cov_40.445609_g5836_i0.p1 GENE.NODE_6429_length_886_cov_40.445609_g5836_i0~~NODE_6429_length_886_cov_40.445609_g5836_i0.p1  ORF type:complete len:145 (-),score=28.80 NODE_6429_length_886_cov_40.445609_g5836_i0:175-609(-)
MRRQWKDRIHVTGRREYTTTAIESKEEKVNAQPKPAPVITRAPPSMGIGKAPQRNMASLKAMAAVARSPYARPTQLRPNPQAVRQPARIIPRPPLFGSQVPMQNRQMAAVLAAAKMKKNTAPIYPMMPFVPPVPSFGNIVVKFV